MRVRSARLSLLACCALLMAGCRDVPGRPGPEPLVPRPDQVVDFKTLYSENCTACHGVEGRNGAAFSLANPAFLASAGVDNIDRIVGTGVPGTQMPPFSKEAGGMLTDQQILIIAQGMVSKWGNPASLGGQTPPAFIATLTGDAGNGQKAYATYCARCHGADGSGGKTGNTPVGSIVDPAYLALISNQGLHTLVIAGLPDSGMPDWRSDEPGHAMSDQEIADVVAWLASHRNGNAGATVCSAPVGVASNE
jgi:mono/diheme cytochrome c family protein